jgi:hypothetical protein
LAYRDKNSTEKRRRLLLNETKSQLTPSLTLDHPNLHQIDPNVPVFLENVVFFELERRPASEKWNCVRTPQNCCCSLLLNTVAGQLPESNFFNLS